MADYVTRGDEQCLRMVQLEDWPALETVNGVFIGHGDLFLSSGKPPSDPEVRALTQQVLAATREAGVFSGVAVSDPAEARAHLDMGFSLVMLSNDTTLFGRAAEAAVKSVEES